MTLQRLAPQPQYYARSNQKAQCRQESARYFIVEVDGYGGEGATVGTGNVHMRAISYLRTAAEGLFGSFSYSRMASPSINEVNGAVMTRVLPVTGNGLGHFVSKSGGRSLDSWKLPTSNAEGIQTLEEAARLLRMSNIPVAFPTETVYGLGADATRSAAVKGIYKAKGRPSDNPLIIHICDLDMLRDLLSSNQKNGRNLGNLIPAIYKPLIHRFWPGPLTILLPNPQPSKLAPEVTAGLGTFGVRMPNSPLALSLIKLAGVPIAAPSANASTKPSTTTADHVLHDLNGRIELILDGGSCEVGVESTIVDGLCSPPVILRPGGVSTTSIRSCPGWEGVQKAYKDDTELDSTNVPRAPGMKYKHYSPKAKIILAEGSSDIIPTHLTALRLEMGSKDEMSVLDYKGLPFEPLNVVTSFHLPTIGVVRTRCWGLWGGWNTSTWTRVVPDLPKSLPVSNFLSGTLSEGKLYTNETPPRLLARIIEISLGTNTRTIAHGLFSALRELDRMDADVIYVEGIDDEGDIFGMRDGEEGGIEAAIMNRLRKAASVVR